MKNALTMLLLAGVLVGAAPPVPLSSLVLNGTSFDAIHEIVIYRRDPLAESPIRITSSNISQQYTDAAMVRRDDVGAFQDFHDVLNSRKLGACDAPVRTIAWAVLFEGANRQRLGAVYLPEDGRCALIKGKSYFIDRDLIQLLRRRFSFMNY